MPKILFNLQVFVVFFFFYFQHTYSQRIGYMMSDSLAVEHTLTSFSYLKNSPINNLFPKIALFFIDMPYEGGTLEKTSANEQLVVNLKAFDCVTFVESCLALTFTLKEDTPSFNTYCRNLQNVRYRSGIIEDYSSRLHYMSDWIINNESNNRLRDVTKDIEGQLINEHISYMSDHIHLYKKLSASEYLQKKIKEIENRLNKTYKRYVIDKSEISRVESLLKNGDIVLFSTTIPGLDFSHLGIIYKNEKQTTFIHASSKAGKVVIEKKGLKNYCRDIKTCDGITVLRLNEYYISYEN